MTKNQLLRIARIQQIDLFFTEKGFSRTYIHEKIIYPTFFMTSRSYYEYLRVNAKKLLREKHGIDWEQELKKHKPVDYLKIMEQMATIDLLQVPEYLMMLQEGAKR